jgi:bile acid:Na+ symporter, BASS family
MGFLIDWGLPAALAFMMVSLGISLTAADFKRVLLQPKAFAVGAFVQMLLLPVSAYFVVLAFGLPPELALGLFILSLCPGGPTSNLFAKLAKGDAALSISLTGVITVTSIFTVPLLATVAGHYFLGLQGAHVSVLPIAARAIIVMLIPISFGMWLKYKAPEWSQRNERFIATIAVGLIAGVILASLLGQWTNFIKWFPILGGACATVMLLMLGSGLVFGKIFGLTQGEASSISIDSAMQNAVMGITMGSMFVTVPGTISLVSMPSGIYGVMMYFVCIPFVLWRRNQAG